LRYKRRENEKKMRDKGEGEGEVEPLTMPMPILLAEPSKPMTKTSSGFDIPEPSMLSQDYSNEVSSMEGAGGLKESLESEYNSEP